MESIMVKVMETCAANVIKTEKCVKKRQESEKTALKTSKKPESEQHKEIRTLAISSQMMRANIAQEQI